MKTVKGPTSRNCAANPLASMTWRKMATVPSSLAVSMISFCDTGGAVSAVVAVTSGVAVGAAVTMVRRSAVTVAVGRGVAVNRGVAVGIIVATGVGGDPANGPQDTTIKNMPASKLYWTRYLILPPLKLNDNSVFCSAVQATPTQCPRYIDALLTAMPLAWCRLHCRANPY